MTIVITVDALKALRSVFGGGRPMTLVKAAGIGIFDLASLPAFAIILFSTSSK